MHTMKTSGQKLTELRGRLYQRHLNDAVRLSNHSQEAYLSNIDKPSAWTLLIELLDYFVSSYISNGKFVFRIWHLGKHINMIRKLWNFFEDLYENLTK